MPLPQGNSLRGGKLAKESEMGAKSKAYEIGKRYYFSLFGVGMVSEIVAGMAWVVFKGYRVAFDGEGRYHEIRIG